MQPLAYSIDTTVTTDEFRSGDCEQTYRNDIAGEYSVSVVTTRDEFVALREPWNKLAERSAHPLLQFSWFSACIDAFSRSREIRIYLVKKGGNVAAIAPMVRTVQHGLARLEILGSSTLCEPAGFLYDSESSLIVLLEQVMASRDVVRIGRIPVRSAEHRLLRLPGRPGLWFHRPSHSPTLPVRTAWEDFESGISSSRRSALRRASRRVQEYGFESMKIHTPSPENVVPLLHEMFDVEHASWKQRTRTSIRSNPEMERFFTSYAASMAAAGALRIGELRTKNRAIASGIAIEFGNRLWILKTGFHEQFSRCSPGILLMHGMVRYAFERSLQAVEFLGRDEPWIAMWTDQHHQYYTHWRYPVRLSGVLSLASDAAGKLLNGVMESLRRR